MPGKACLFLMLFVRCRFKERLHPICKRYKTDSHHLQRWLNVAKLSGMLKPKERSLLKNRTDYMRQHVALSFYLRVDSISACALTCLHFGKGELNRLLGSLFLVL